MQARGEEYAEDAKRQLKTRGQQEAKAMQNILETQSKHIGNTEAKHARDNGQGVLPFFENEDEQRQLEANKRYWAKRLTMIERELLTEPKRIASLYQVQATRIEPVGLVYLWPVTG